MKNTFKGWSLFEVSWLSIFLIINLYLFFVFQDTLLGLISSTAGVLCVVLAGKGKISNYYVGIVQASTYAYISYQYGLFGEAMLNGLFYFPMQFIGIYLWNKNKVSRDVKGEEIKVRTMTKEQWFVLIPIIIVSSLIYAVLLNAIGGQQVHLDSFAVVISIFAQFLMIKRFAEQWILWITVNVLSISLWVTALIQNGGNDWSMVLMWISFLLNSIISWINWKKFYKGQKEVELVG